MDIMRTCATEDIWSVAIWDGRRLVHLEVFRDSPLSPLRASHRSFVYLEQAIETLADSTAVNLAIPCPECGKAMHFSSEYGWFHASRTFDCSNSGPRFTSIPRSRFAILAAFLQRFVRGLSLALSTSPR